MEAETHYIRTYSGLLFDLENPAPSQISIIDIAHGLSLCNRWSGMTREAYSVGQHSIHVALRMRSCGYDSAHQFAALMHDASEAYTGDMVTPLKHLCPFFQAIEITIQGAIETVFGIKHSDEVKKFDTDAYRLEYRDLMIGEHGDIVPPVGNQATLESRPAPMVERAFLDLFWQLNGGGAVLDG